ncbi:unnamed protein product [Nippostrongylus brasiliensis]|uniref:FMN hydroxy acid dehydrogenase domain-containing protein n=1 Tax=Nippostrongylus brasiliensis TaxID=27835 RepID=A0A0N4YB22_NIPBR|nr:unnamed protein product [Nippostrongylus brasiliensis]
MSQPDRLLLTVDDFRHAASSKLKKLAKDYYESGSDDQLTLRRNERAFERLLIRPRCLRDVSNVDTSTEWFGRKQRFPIGIAPTAFHRMANEDGELNTVKGASAAGSVMIVSSWATTAIEEVAEQSRRVGAELWFQLYVYKDKNITTSLVKRAEASGCRALVLTVDTPVLGRRLPDVRNGFTLPDGLGLANFSSMKPSSMPNIKSGQSGLMQYVSEQIDPTLNWEIISWLLETTKLPIIVKGVMRGDDAEEAIRRGAHGIIVSNHGGRQMDSAPATIEALADVVRASRGRVPVFMDGGVRNGRDIFKAIALGAQGVFVGRPVLWGLSVKGSEGVYQVMSILQQEFVHTMKLAGFRSIKEIQECPDVVVREEFFSKL